MSNRISRSGENQTLTPADLLSATITTETGCMEWQRRRSPTGYGEVGAGGRKYRTHRLMTFLVYGLPKPGDHALHSCDNPPCINPDHLRWGTHQENMADRVTRKRGASNKGEKHYFAKLNEDKVKLIRIMSANGATLKEMADYFGCSSGAIAGVKFNRTWTHVK